MNVIDLTHRFSATMPTYPGDPEPELKRFDKGDCVDHLLKTSMHVGTHMDGPLHMIKGGKYLSEIPAEQFIGPGYLIDARGRDTVDESLFESAGIAPGGIVLILTGHGAEFGQPGYFDRYPVLSEGFARACVEKGVKIVGMDTPSPDVPPFPVHHILLGNGVLIIENLANLELLAGVKTFTIAALPFKLHADAAPVRVVAMVE